MEVVRHSAEWSFGFDWNVPDMLDATTLLSRCYPAWCSGGKYPWTAHASVTIKKKKEVSKSEYVALHTKYAQNISIRRKNWAYDFKNIEKNIYKKYLFVE